MSNQNVQSQFVPWFGNSAARFTAVKEGLRKSAKTRSFFVNNLNQGSLFQGSEAFSQKEKLGLIQSHYKICEVNLFLRR
jgi:hypothetical protein